MVYGKCRERTQKLDTKGGLQVNSGPMAKSKLAEFGAFVKANALFDLVVEEMGTLKGEPMCWRLDSQQVTSADSISANIEEGYGRGSTRDFVYFLVIARGSARETCGRYTRMKPWLPTDLIAARTALCEAIIHILTATIQRLRSREKAI